MRRRYRSFLSWLRRALTMAPLALAGCSAPLQYQQQLGTIHTAAARQCKTAHLTCAALAPCSTAVRTALQDWQAVSLAASKDDAPAEAAALVVASVSHQAAVSVCAAKGIKP